MTGLDWQGPAAACPARLPTPLSAQGGRCPAATASNRIAPRVPVPDAPVASPGRVDRDVHAARADLLRERGVHAARAHEAALLHAPHPELRRIKVTRDRDASRAATALLTVIGTVYGPPPTRMRTVPAGVVRVT